MNKQILRITLGFLACIIQSASVMSQIITAWDVPYQHSMTPNLSNEARKVVTNPATGFIYTLVDVTSDTDPSGTVTGLTYSYCIINRYDSLGDLQNSAVIDVINHHVDGFDQKSGFALEMDAAGNLYVGYMIYNPATDFDIKLAKYDGQLNLIWNYTFNSATEDYGIDMKVNNTGTAFAIIRSTASGNVRYRIIKANASGTSSVPLYQYSQFPDFLSSLAVDANQRVYTAGYQLVNGVKNIMISCVNDAGMLIWEKTDNCGTITGDDFARHIILGHDGALYLTGSSQGTTQHGVDAVVMKIDPVNGKKVWDNFVNFTLTDGGYFVRTFNTQNMVVCWTTDSTVYVDQLLCSNGSRAGRASYQPVLAIPTSSVESIVVADMQISSSKFVYLTGTVYATATTSLDFSAYYLAKISFQGRGSVANIIASIPCEGSPNGSYRSTGIALNQSKDQIYMLYDQASSFQNHIDETVWLMGNNVLPALRQDTAVHPAYDVYPNPFTDLITVKCDQEFIYSICDITGKSLVAPSVSGSTYIQKDASGLAPGLYLLSVQDLSGNVQTFRITKY